MTNSQAVASARASALADRLESGAGSLAAYAERLSDAEWKVIVPGDGRTIGVVVHHVASVYPIEVQLAQKIASGEAIAGVTMDAIHDMNAKHAVENAEASKAETLELLRTNSKAAAELIRAFSDEELDSAKEVSLYGDAVLSAQFFLEDHAVRHSLHHLASVRRAFES